MGTPIDTNDLLRRIEFIERHLGIKQSPGEPLQPLGPLFTLSPMPPRQDEARCPKCGITFSQTLSYFCDMQDCPSGLGARDA